MTDKELLEAAAKAAGLEYAFDASGPNIKEFGRWRWWNPLVDSADAFHLAVKLGMEVAVDMEFEMARAYVPGSVQGYSFDYSHCDNDAANALRCAITEAAARSTKD